MIFNYDNQSTAVADDECVCEEPKEDRANMTNTLQLTKKAQEETLMTLIRILRFVNDPEDGIDLFPEEKCLMDTLLNVYRRSYQIQYLVENLAEVIGA